MASRRARMGLSIATLLAGVLAVAPVAAGAPRAPSGLGPAWSTPARVIAGGGFRDVSAAIDSAGTAHLVAVGSSGVWYATNRSGSWSARRILDHREFSEWRQASLALDDDDRLHIALSEGFESKFGILPGRIWTITDRGRPRGTFSAPDAVTPWSATDPSLKTPDGHTYLAYTGEVCFDVCEGASSRVFYQTDGTSGTVRRRLPFDASRPDLRVDDAGRPRIVYAAAGATRTRVVLARGSSRTGTFTTELVAREAGWVTPRLVLDDADRPLLAWVLAPFGDDPSRVVFARRIGGDWVRRSVGTGDAVGISVDAADRAHLAVGGPAGVREVVIRDPLVTLPIDGTAAVRDVDLRIPATGKALVAYIRNAPDPGVYIARR